MNVKHEAWRQFAKTFATVISAFGLAGLSSGVNASLVFSIQSGSTTIIVADEQASGASTSGGNTTTAADSLLGTVGNIGFSGTVGVFNVVAVGTSKPVLGPAPTLSLSLYASSSGMDSLTVYLWDTDFELTTSQQLNIEYGGTSNGNVYLQGLVDAQNREFEATSGTGAVTLFPGAFGGYRSNQLSGLSTPFSMGADATITHLGAGATSLDLTTTLVPEPTTLALLGVGLAGLGLARRRRAQ